MTVNLNATILGQTISFILFVWFCMKYIWPPIILAIETRQKEIKQSLIIAKQAKEELSIIQRKMEIEIQEAKEKASTILNEANKQKLFILETAKEQALEESKKILIKAQLEIDMKIASARKNLQKEIVDLSVSIAEKVIKKNVCQDKNEILVDELVVSLSQVKN
ncbi:F0F1 ATP synthase subunit B [Buchnera aphidicola]|uniref:ATP synthase subunit b n=1 Tax=Buchnera aphidicola str. USDA (Myzus persicae) TaxID=1009856 RepID=W0P0T1_BUCMP|nr:F0F1 ATP synthase subunit B [Buchnera aphidicola]AHG60354.1 Atpf [Buchnera aphidicola str. USDA (Myzus persicae)]AHG60932.1 Atpf [Buchnera aphidicola str. W106 (Myzus persicae)]AHG61504.1 Atpf [Buchnera aphidicola str. G002 (Myzus persicae)]AHG62077.1 Atpf [Buchnera aphidicola str. F009 (Myzus persicae)]WAI02958.1 MAG: F0F1 ATP synthase subunit B [Buchnera aphidicola (Myzus persicae)]